MMTQGHTGPGWREREVGDRKGEQAVLGTQRRKGSSWSEESGRDSGAGSTGG